MGCGCGGNRSRSPGGEEILGYRVIRPDGTLVPPETQSPFLSAPEARAEVRASGGGTVRSVTRAGMS
ncbi:DUF7196 family protein [Mycobacteroides abscessus]